MIGEEDGANALRAMPASREVQPVSDSPRLEGDDARRADTAASQHAPVGAEGPVAPIVLLGDDAGVWSEARRAARRGRAVATAGADQERDQRYAETMKTGVPMWTWSKSHSASGICIRMQPWEAE